MRSVIRPSWARLVACALWPALLAPAAAGAQRASLAIGHPDPALETDADELSEPASDEAAGRFELRLDGAYAQPDAAFREGVAMAIWLASASSAESAPAAQPAPEEEEAADASDAEADRPDDARDPGDPEDDDPDSNDSEDDDPDSNDSDFPFDLELHGFGEMDFAYHDYGLNQTGVGGAPPDSRAVFDQTRFALVLEAELGWGFEFEAEIEFEHGGTGAEMELEYEEFGEYEFDVGAGGEVVIEEMVLRKDFDDWLTIGIGRLYVGVGLLPYRHRPQHYLGTTRPESETRVLPAVWDELGLQSQLRLGPFQLTLQVITGLDSTGFSSQFWVSSGHQGRFELIRATDLAFAGRVDVRPADGISFGVSGYFGNTTGNRPKPDLQGVAGELGITSAHFVLELAPVRAHGAFVWGYLSDAPQISDRNRRLSNNLEVLRSPVASQAIALWGELGLDVLHFTDLRGTHRLEPFVRAEWYDTMFAVEAGTFDNPRFERVVLSGGLAYAYDDSVVLKLDFAHRRFGTSELRPENTVRLAVGFTY